MSDPTPPPYGSSDVELSPEMVLNSGLSRYDLRIAHRLDLGGNPAGGSATGVGLEVRFQDGPLGRGPGRLEPNGCFVEHLILVAMSRLLFFESGTFSCAENRLALEHLAGAMDALESRTRRREAAGVEGTHAEDGARGRVVYPNTPGRFVGPKNFVKAETTGDRCRSMRAGLATIEMCARALNEALKDGHASGEAIAQSMLAVRHIEDARMRIGKVLQHTEGCGVSCYEEESR